tara:strand:- start:243 stop:584 length:342 start_codon:yes stop_codon:yes gene_type:complete
MEISNQPTILSLLDCGILVTVERERGACEVRLWDSATHLHPASGTDWASSYLVLGFFEHAQLMLEQYVKAMEDEVLTGGEYDECALFALDELLLDVVVATEKHLSFQQQSLFS